MLVLQRTIALFGVHRVAWHHACSECSLPPMCGQLFIFRLAVHATHPLGGPGILVVTTVPIHHENTVIAARILNELNRIECKQSVKTISTGAWCLDPKLKRFSHVSFWPTARVDSSMVPDLLAREESRIRWVHRTLKSMGARESNG